MGHLNRALCRRIGDVVILFMLSISHVSAVKANQTKQTLAQRDYAAVIAAVKTAHSELAQGMSFRFVSVIGKQAGDLVTNEHQLILSERLNEQISPALSDTTTSENLQWSQSVFVNPEQFPAQPELINDTGTEWVFAMPIALTATTDNEAITADVNRANNTLGRHLNARLHITKHPLALSSYKVDAVEPFSPQMLTTIETFKVRIEFAQAWPNGPWVNATTTRQLVGRAGFFFSINECSTLSLKNFKKK